MTSGWGTRASGNGTPVAWQDLLIEMAKYAALAERYGAALGIEPELANTVDSASKAGA